MRKTTRLNLKRISIKIKLLPVFLILAGNLWAQEAVFKGRVFDDFEFPLMDVSISDGSTTVYTDADGEFSIRIPAGEEVSVIFAQEGKIPFTEKMNLKEGETRERIIVMADEEASVRLKEAVIFQSKPRPVNSISLDPAKMSDIAGITGGVTEMLGSLPMVSVGSELTSQYRVRGGNYDENLIYVNGMEIYKPQLIRSGEQEGLGFVNPAMTDAVNFSAGGWEAKYGDKMSSVLDIIYKRPREFEAALEASLMGGSLTVGGGSKDRKFSAIVGARYQDRDLVLNTLDNNSDINPVYYDAQAYLNYRFNPKWELSFLGAITESKFHMVPKDRDTKFGTLDTPMSLTVFYDGNEEDKFNTETGSLSLVFKPSTRMDLVLDVFGYHSKEKEYFDIYGAYLLNELDGDGNILTTYDIGSQIDHARNNFDSKVYGVQHRAKYDLDINNSIEWGLKFQHENIRDILGEWQLLDSIGYSVPGTETPGGWDPDQLLLNYSVHARNKLNSSRFSGYAQYTKKFLWGKNKVLINAGLRGTYWDFNEEFDLSPRAQAALRLFRRGKEDMTLRFNTGLYYQPPFYREVRRLDGTLNEKVKSQRSMHFIFGHDYEFKMWGNDFKLTTEAYYKLFHDLNPYFVDNLRIRYMADNNSKGHGYGVDMRLYGEFVKGIDSWLSLSYARAYQNIDGQGKIPLPTDPRFKASIFFQDYMPILPSFKVSVNLVYASGMPNGAPPLTDPYQYTKYLTDYKRVDIGFLKEFINQTDLKAKGNFWKNFKELSLGVDLFNIFDNRNHISNSWIRDMNSAMIFAVPNRLTGRFLNAKIRMKF